MKWLDFSGMCLISLNFNQNRFWQLRNLGEFSHCFGFEKEKPTDLCSETLFTMAPASSVLKITRCFQYFRIVYQAVQTREGRVDISVYNRSF